MWVITLLVEQVVLTLIVSFGLYGLWRLANPGKKY